MIITIYICIFVLLEKYINSKFLEVERMGQKKTVHVVF